MYIKTVIIAVTLLITSNLNAQNAPVLKSRSGEYKPVFWEYGLTMKPDFPIQSHYVEK